MRDLQRQQYLASQLRPISGEDAYLEAGFLLDYVDAHPDTDLSALLQRRLSGEPLQYVLGEWEFFGLPFSTDHRALIPRPDTEILCETALSFLHIGDRVLDLCCGSGCIGIALAAHTPIDLTSADISEDALALTRENAKRNGIALQTVQSDMFSNVEGTFDMIVCNPPYLNEQEMRSLDPSLLFEPHNALDGGKDGLDFYRCIAAQYDSYLRPGGYLLLEIGYTQEKAVCAMFYGARCIRDYGDRPRVVVVQKHD